jgi:DNA-binding transcriptional ArsR family regulator
MVERHDTDLLFKALADPSRRKLLDLLHAHDGRTLNELCEHLDMTRQGVTQHLDLLEAANLVATVRRGREKLHFLNPVPLQEIYERWIAKFERPRLKALSNLKKQWRKPMAESMTGFFLFLKSLQKSTKASQTSLTCFVCTCR